MNLASHEYLADMQKKVDKICVNSAERIGKLEHDNDREVELMSEYAKTERRGWIPSSNLFRLAQIRELKNILEHFHGSLDQEYLDVHNPYHARG
mgnify:CR=1 FL=1